MTATKVDASAVQTVSWLRSQAEIAVPVYQRHYRWDVDRCRQLLNDVRAAADSAVGEVHFLGSILATAVPAATAKSVLIDGQQRVTTLTLLVAALRDTLKEADPELASSLQEMLVAPPAGQEATKLRPHEGRQNELTDIVFNPARDCREPGESALEDNYRYFLGEVHRDAVRVYRGLERLEHVMITLAEGANAQQVFESLNSTSVPLRDHDLVHNYVLMGLSYDVQEQIERDYWVPLELNAGEFTDQFLRDYLIRLTGRDSDVRGEHGVYQVFKSQFPRLLPESIRKHAAEWLSYAEDYGNLLDPSRVNDDEIRTQLGYVNTFGTAMYPIVMAVYRDYRKGDIDRDTFIEILEQLQALYLRRMVVGETRDHLAAQLCRRLSKYGYPIRDMGRRSPSDERVRNALKYRHVPHVGYVLHRLEGLTVHSGLQIEHIFPQTPTSSWTGNGERIWSSMPEEEQARYQALVDTLGNLVLLESHLNAGASNRSFIDKHSYYTDSAVKSAKALADHATWDSRAIEKRTEELIGQFLKIWPRPSDDHIEDAEHLVPLLEAEKKPGWYPGWKNEFSYVMYRDEIWEEHNLKTLYNHVFKRLWATQRADLLAYTAMNAGPVHATEEWPSQWDALEGSHYLFMGLGPQYMLAEVQRVLDEFGIADEVFVKYAIDS
ncbi:DUF262 domain-containing protein [Ilumatobacter sp.]|uniref:DUF262 domain-containing protein n=1 Tax=Ilumatobacter sp. TaxID=1967498 RepID=UPI00375332A4